MEIEDINKRKRETGGMRNTTPLTSDEETNQNKSKKQNTNNKNDKQTKEMTTNNQTKTTQSNERLKNNQKAIHNDTDKMPTYNEMLNRSENPVVKIQLTGESKLADKSKFHDDGQLYHALNQSTFAKKIKQDTLTVINNNMIRFENKCSDGLTFPRLQACRSSVSWLA